MTYVYIVLGLLAAVAGFRYVRRLRATRVERAPRLTDEMVRRIEQEGRIQAEEEEALDLDEIREEEQRFWSESWDEPEEL